MVIKLELDNILHQQVPQPLVGLLLGRELFNKHLPKEFYLYLLLWAGKVVVVFMFI